MQSWNNNIYQISAFLPYFPLNTSGAMYFKVPKYKIRQRRVIIHKSRSSAPVSVEALDCSVNIFDTPKSPKAISSDNKNQT